MNLLRGQRILVTRYNKQAKPFTEFIEQQGGISIEIPLLLFNRIQSEENAEIIKNLSSVDWIFFTSSNGIHSFFEWCEQLHIDERVIKEKSIAVVGKKTAQVLEKYGYKANFLPENYTGLALGEEFIKAYRKQASLLLIQGNKSTNSLFNALQNSSHTIKTAVLYETNVNVKMEQKLKDYLNHSEIDVLTFTSPSSIQAFVQLGATCISDEILALPCVCIGPTTEEEARKNGFETIIVPSEHTIEGMMDELENYLKRKGK